MGRPLKVTSPVTSGTLAAAAKKEKDPRVRARIIAMRMILLGGTVPVAAKALALGEWQLRKWVHRFNDKGLEGLRDRPRPGQPPKLAPNKVDKFKTRIKEGPLERDHVCTLRGKDVQRILIEEFNADYSLVGTYFLLHRLGFSSLVPRPRHPKADQLAQDEFKKNSTPGPRRRKGSASREVR